MWKKRDSGKKSHKRAKESERAASFETKHRLQQVGKGGFGRVRVIKPREKMMMNAKSPRAGYDHGGKLDMNREDSSRYVKLDDYATCVKLMNKVSRKNERCFLVFNFGGIQSGLKKAGNRLFSPGFFRTALGCSRR